jgi:osmotically-inducible protein OsmY
MPRPDRDALWPNDENGGRWDMRLGKTMILFSAALLLAGAAHASGAAQTGAAEPPSDRALKQSVISRILDARAAFFADIQLDIIGGDALLTGRVASLQDKARASALVRSVPGIQTVINEIHVGATDDVKRIAGDLLIERTIRKAMHDVFGAQLPDLNWRVTNGVVYVFGRPKSEWEHNKALTVIRQTQGIAQVVDHLKSASNGG